MSSVTVQETAVSVSVGDAAPSIVVVPSAATLSVSVSGGRGDIGPPGPESDNYEHSTGVVWGLGLAVNGADPKKLDILPGAAVFIDNFTTPGTTVRSELSLPDGIVGITPDWGTGGRHPVYVTLDKTGTVYQSIAAPSLADLADYTYIGVFSCTPSTTTIEAVYQYQFGAVNSITRFEQFSVCLGSFNIYGNVYGPAVATPTLGLRRSAGQIFRVGSNMGTLPKVPDIVNTPATATGQSEVFMSTRHVSGAWAYVPATAVDPENYDNLTDLVPMTPNYWQIKTLFYSPSIVFFQYGQKQYITQSEAENDIFGTIEIYSILPRDFVFRGWLITQQGCTDLNDTAKAKFIPAGKFGLDSPGGSTRTVAVGSDKEISFNDGGVQSGDPDLRWDKNEKTLAIGNPDTLPNNPLALGGAIDGWFQANINNTTEGTEASSDWVATADNGTDSTNYIDVGVNSSIYASGDYPAYAPNDAYLSAESPRILINTIRSGAPIVFATGGVELENIDGYITSSGINLSVGREFMVDGVPVALSTNHPDIFYGTGAPPSASGLVDGTMFFKYE
jgi:hypothetical protein